MDSTPQSVNTGIEEQFLVYAVTEMALVTIEPQMQRFASIAAVGVHPVD